MDTTYSPVISYPLLDEVLNSSTVGIACFDGSFNLSGLNELFCSTLRLESIPQKLTDLNLFSSEELDYFMRELQAPPKKAFNISQKINWAAESISILNLKLIGKFKDDQLIGGILIAEDATSDEHRNRMFTRMHNKLSENEAFFERLYHKNPIGILMINPINAKILRANPRICKMLGYKEEELKRMTAYDITHPDDRQVHKKQYQTSLDSEDNTFDFNKRYIKKDGSVIWVNIAASIVKDAAGVSLYDLATIQDVTGKVQAQNLIRNQVKELNAQNLKLEQYIESNLQLENFAYIASHDLKAPLRTIGNFAQLLNRRMACHYSQDEKEYMQYLLEGVSDMNQLIENLLLYSKINSTENTVRKLDLPDILFKVLRSLNVCIEEKGARVFIERIPEAIVANKTKITQLFQNLIANGIKFQQGNHVPEVRISGKELADRWQFKITDNGIGMEKKYHNQIFTLFKRLHCKDEYGGSGIGLAYCKRVVEKHGGDIWLESEPGKGTIFYFTIKK